MKKTAEEKDGVHNCFLCKRPILKNLRNRKTLQFSVYAYHADCWRRGKVGKLIQMLFAHGSLQKL